VEILESLVVPTADSLIGCKTVEVVTATEILAETAVDSGDVVVSIRAV
jgi:hypothetical protein